MSQTAANPKQSELRDSLIDILGKVRESLMEYQIETAKVIASLQQTRLDLRESIDSTPIKEALKTTAEWAELAKREEVKQGLIAPSPEPD